MKIPKDMIKGSVFESKKYGVIEVVDYVKSSHVEIVFVNTGCKVIARSDHIREGAVKDPMKPSVCVVGFYGIGEHKAKIGGVFTKQYDTWRKMLTRCYVDSYKKRYPTYEGCTVCDEWHNFQNYAGWHIRNYPNDGIKYHLDKDIKVDGNKIYSPDTCLFVTAQQNAEKALAKNYTLIKPCGEIINIYNLLKFCNENGLCSQAMHLVRAGRMKHHKGWRFA